MYTPYDVAREISSSWKIDNVKIKDVPFVYILVEVMLLKIN